MWPVLPYDCDSPLTRSLRKSNRTSCSGLSPAIGLFLVTGSSGTAGGAAELGLRIAAAAKSAACALRLPSNARRGVGTNHPSDPCLRWSVSADVALSEKSPYLGGAWVRWGVLATPSILAVVDIFKLRIIVWPSSHHSLFNCKQRGTQGFPLVPGRAPGHSQHR